MQPFPDKHLVLSNLKSLILRSFALDKSSKRSTIRSLLTAKTYAISTNDVSVNFHSGFKVYQVYLEGRYVLRRIYLVALAVLVSSGSATEFL
jgi:hypothetical protein